jgi:HD-GYP domain-containing protein (c-di-GMP phosphodiesterase class II)
MLNIHRAAFKRLLIGWLLISLVIGVGVYIYETEAIDDQVSELAAEEAQSLAASDIARINGSAAQQAGLVALGDKLLGEHFAVVELYDRNKNKVLERVRDGQERVEEVLKKKRHAFPLSAKVKYNRFDVDGQMVLQVLAPLLEGGRVAGYFEGVYVVDAATLSALEEQMRTVLVVVFIVILATTLMLYPFIVSLNREVLRSSRAILRGNVELMEVLGGAIAQRDSDTNIHNYRVTLYATALGEAVGMADGAIRDLIAGAFLHDVGKIGIPDSILLKPAKLTAEEFATMRTHVTLGIDIIERSAWLKKARDVVEFHHEKFDGSGYMRGLAGEAIPLAARVFAVADVFDALTSKRPYKEPMSCAEALAIVERDAGQHFDPQVVAAFAGIAAELHRDMQAASDASIVARLSAVVERYYLG